MEAWILFYQYKRRYPFVEYDSPLEEIVFNSLLLLPIIIGYELEKRCYKEFGEPYVPFDVLEYREHLHKLRPGTTFKLAHLTLEIVSEGFCKGYYLCKDISTGQTVELSRQVILRAASIKKINHS
ncbi:MAG: hypothetical protein KME23_08125 [Goleter apudmare HA4340-LM2]|nr:hypothetical protein [Goleter apudmare HA4340-LM2]